MVGEEDAVGGAGDAPLRPVALAGPAPGPGVAQPEGGEQVKDRLLRAPVGAGHPDQDVVGGGLRVLHQDVEVAIEVEDAGVLDLELRLIATTPPVLLQQPRVGNSSCGYL